MINFVDIVLLAGFISAFLFNPTRNSAVSLIVIFSWFPLFIFIDSWLYIQLSSALVCAVACRFCSSKPAIIMFAFALVCYLMAVDAIMYPTVSTFLYNIYQYIDFALNLLLLYELGRDRGAKFFDTSSILPDCWLCNLGRVPPFQKRDNQR